MSSTASDEADLDYLARYESSRGYLHFLDHWTVNAQPDPLPFWEIAEPWQWDREERRDRAIDNICGIAPYHGKRWFWTGCAKGNDKSTGVGRRCVYCLAFSKKPVQIYVCSGKLEQAAIVTTAMKAEVELNPWLKDKVTVHDHGAEGVSGSKLTVLPMKAATGQGIFPDYLIADEVTHWEHEEGRKFWNFVVASVVKRPQCLFEVLTNAGFKGSWQWEARNAAKDDTTNWDFFEQPERTRLASWMSENAIEAMGKSMFPGERDRLLHNRWIDPGEESGYITLEEAEACIDPLLTERTQGDPTLRYYAIVDYGSGVGERNRDRTALCILHSVPGTDRIVVDRLDCWMHPTKPIPIDIPDGDPHARSVEGWIELVRKNFRLAALVLDKYQMESLAQKYERRNLRVVRYDHQAGKKNMAMAQVLRELVRNRRVTWSDQAGRLSGVEDDTFAKELSKLVLKEMSYGYRFDHTSGHHDDRAVAVGMGMTTAIEEIRPAGSAGPKGIPQPPLVQEESGLPKVRKDWMEKRGLFGVNRY